MIQLPDIYSIQAKAQRATLKGDLNRAITLLKTAADKYDELMTSVDEKDEENINLIKAIQLIRQQVLKRVNELEILINNKEELKEASHQSDNSDDKDSSSDIGASKNEENNYRRQVVQLMKKLSDGMNASKLDSTILDLRKKLKILKINGNNIDLVTTPEQKLKYENDLLNRIQLSYDLKMGEFDKFFQKLVILTNGNGRSELALQDQFSRFENNNNSSGDEEIQEDSTAENIKLKQEVALLRQENGNLQNQVTKLNTRWNELVESAKKRKERELQK